MARGSQLADREGKSAPEHKRMPLYIALLAALRGYCPNCHVGRLFDGFIRPRMGCDVCGMVYHRDSSTWLGAAFVMYFLSAFVLGIEATALWLLFGLFPGYTIVMIVSCVAVVILLFRPVRGLWIWLLWRIGFLS